MKRRENDKKILLLFVKMKDMMSVLTQSVPIPSLSIPVHINVHRRLSALKATDATTPDGKSIADKVEPLCVRTEVDIRSCSNACDAYNRKRLLVKVLTGQIWAQRLGSYITLFTERENDFLLAMDVQTMDESRGATTGRDEIKETVRIGQRRTKERSVPDGPPAFQELNFIHNSGQL